MSPVPKEHHGWLYAFSASVVCYYVNTWLDIVDLPSVSFVDWRSEMRTTGLALGVLAVLLLYAGWRRKGKSMSYLWNSAWLGALAAIIFFLVCLLIANTISLMRSQALIVFMQDVIWRFCYLFLQAALVTSALSTSIAMYYSRQKT